MASYDSNVLFEPEFDDEVSEEGNSSEEDNLGTAPYMFEPLIDDPDAEMTVEVEEESDRSHDNAVNRLGNTTWWVLVSHGISLSIK